MYNFSNPYAQPETAPVPLRGGGTFYPAGNGPTAAPAPAMKGGPGPQVMPGMQPPTQTPTGPTNYYGMVNTPDDNEKQAGVNPQPFYSMLNQQGNVGGPYAVDPTQSSAFKQEAQIAQSGDLSPWAQLQMKQNDLNLQTAKDQNASQNLGATDQAMQNIMVQGGGAASGAAQQIAGQGARAQTMANQQANANANNNALSIQQTDAQNKQSLLGQVASTETAAQGANATTAQQDTTNANLYATNRYNQQMGAYGAQQSANAQRASANSGKK